MPDDFLGDADVAVLRGLIDMPVVDLYELLGTAPLDRLERLAGADPERFGAAVGELLLARDRPDEDPGALLGWLRTVDASWVPAAAAMARRDSRLAGLIAAEVGMPGADLWEILPLSAVTAGYAAGEWWARSMLTDFLGTAQSAPDDRWWERVAALLDTGAEGPDHLADRIRDSLSATEWARADPWPAIAPFVDEVGRRRTVPGRAFDRPYSELFGRDEPRVRRAAVEAGHLEATVARWLDAGRDVGRWLGHLGRLLPGCGEPGCCRPSLLEADLVRRGHRPRLWPWLPPSFSSRR
ncbi:hypothetical protein [Couchioplanes caeruleus]|uniref:Uncharacterized protein n=2 Tax=Couchioplanes caeruleus TaxID=56438 RepID=A0A1K0FL73_9ACTN|nr:hypothetical protein [Couchioplanes caeruleus]OJF13480.1 hypothetical protein BG844_15000 [Couchioplanes caeruleus subsp. caeruleus]ROP28570.1 hypothetical protein EDD30_1334 [Couchioplanes caeruleus]